MIIETIVTTMDASGVVNIAPMGVEWMGGEGGVTRFLEVGPGNVLCGLVKRISSGKRSIPCGDPERLEALMQELGA